jgi:hypothetical protein
MAGVTPANPANATDASPQPPLEISKGRICAPHQLGECGSELIQVDPDGFASGLGLVIS